MYFTPVLVLFAAVVAVVILAGTFVAYCNNALGFLTQVLLRVLGPVVVGIAAFFGLMTLVVRSILHGNDPDDPAAVTLGCVMIIGVTCASVLFGCVSCRNAALEYSVARDVVSWSYWVAAALVFPIALGIDILTLLIPMTASDGGDPTIADYTAMGFMVYLFGFCLLVTAMVALYGAFCKKPARVVE